MMPIRGSKFDISVVYAKQFFISLKNKFSSSRSKAKKDKIKKIWSGEIKRTTDLSLIRRYHLEKCRIAKHTFVDDTTWADLNMDAVFRKIDRCTSVIGSQYLYHLLHRYETDQKKLYRYYSEYNTFLSDGVLREKIQQPLLRLTRTGACYLADLLFSDLPGRPWYFFLFIASSLLLLASIIASFFHAVFIFAILFFGITNLLVHLFYTSKIAGYIPDLSVLSHMLGIVGSLSRLEDAQQFPQLRCLKSHCRAAARLNKKIGWLVVDKYKLGDIAASIYDYLNHFFLMDLIIYLISIDEIKARQKSLIDMYENIASLDVAISVSSYLNSISRYCRPVLNEENLIEATELFHPLIEAPVPNTFSMENTSIFQKTAGITSF